MATRIVTPVGAPPSPMSMEAAIPALKELIDKRQSQLNSLLMHCYGNSSEAFDHLGAGHRDNILWLASELGQEIEEAFDDFTTLLARGAA